MGRIFGFSVRRLLIQPNKLSIPAAATAATLAKPNLINQAACFNELAFQKRMTHHRHFEGKNHAKLYAQNRPLPPDTLVHEILRYIQQQYTGSLDLAVDIGCGTGQSTQCLSPYFRKVIGTDISPAQVAQATKRNQCDNIVFLEGAAEVIPAEDSSVQLITASQAAHWFDLPKLYKEGLRALCPGGVLAIYGYELPKFRWDKNSEKNSLLDNLLQELYQGDLNGYWAMSERQHVDKRYIEFVIPYEDFQRIETLYNDVEMTVSGMVRYFETWSGYQKFCELNGEAAGHALKDKFLNGIMEILEVDTSPEATVFTQRTDYFLLLGRKSVDNN